MSKIKLNHKHWSKIFGVVCVILHLAVGTIPSCDRRTDGRTDGLTDGHTTTAYTLLA